MKQLIEQRTVQDRKFKDKRQELDGIKQQINEINNTDLFDMTFEMYVKKSALHEYHYNQSDQLQKRMNEVRLDRLNGDLKKNIINYIRQQADDCSTVLSKFEEFESNPRTEWLEEEYRKAFDNEVDKLHGEAIELLGEYFGIVGKESERIFRVEFGRELPAPITRGDIGTNVESEQKGIPYDYARRTSRRLN